MEQLAKLTRFLMALAKAKFYGAITFKFEAGKVTHIRQETSIKPDTLPEK